jgi:exonuclease VII large subunit
MVNASVFDRGLVDEHHRDVIPDRVDTVALVASEACAVVHGLHGRLAGRAHQDLEQSGINGHG